MIISPFQVRASTPLIKAFLFLVSATRLSCAGAEFLFPSSRSSHAWAFWFTDLRYFGPAFHFCAAPPANPWLSSQECFSGLKYPGNGHSPLLFYPLSFWEENFEKTRLISGSSRRGFVLPLFDFSLTFFYLFFPVLIDQFILPLAIADSWLLYSWQFIVQFFIHMSSVAVKSYPNNIGEFTISDLNWKIYR